MEPFLVAPSEAMLIGLCYGEYRALKQCIPQLAFISVQARRLDPFVPNLTVIRRQPIAAQDIPDDVDWMGVDTGWKSGGSVSNPGYLFGLDDQGYFKKRVDLSRKNVSTLLTLYLIDHLGFEQSEKTRLLKWTADPLLDIGKASREMLNAHLERLEHFAYDDPRCYGVYGECDDLKGIETRLQQLVHFNELSRPYALGELLGGLIGGITLYRDEGESWLFAMLFVMQALSNLAGADEVRDSPIVECALNEVFHVLTNECEAFDVLITSGALEAMLHSVMPPGAPPIQMPPYSKTHPSERQLELFDRDKMKLRREATLTYLDRVWMPIWTMCGALLGSYRDADAEVLARDACSTQGRSFTVLPHDSPDKVRRALAQADTALAYERESLIAEQVVTQIVPAIEATARHLWKEEFTRAGNGKLADILYKKLQSSTETDRRFASIAMSLHKTYRNPAIHQFASFQCSINEARFVVAGLRTLLEMSEGYCK